MEPLSITLTRDELIVFLAVIGSTTMNGLDDDPLTGLDEREVAERLNGGEQSLINRGLLVIGDDENATLDDVLVALVGGSVIPEATFLLTQMYPDGQSDPHYFNATPELLVEHHSPRAGVHVFDYIPEPEALILRVQTLLAPLHPIPEPANGAGHLVPSKVLSQFIEHCGENEQAAARQALTEAGLAQDMATQLTEDYTTRGSWVGVVGLGLRQGEPEGGDSVMVILGQDHCWLVENVTDHPDHVSVRQTSGAQCEDAFVALLRPLQQGQRPSE